MLNAISPYGSYAAYGAAYASRTALAQGLDKAQSAQRTAPQWGPRKAAQPESPVQPVTPARPVAAADDDPAASALLRYNSDPSAMAVRMRIQQPGGPSAAQAAGQAQGQDAKAPQLPGQKSNPLPGVENPEAEGAKSAQEVMEEGECQTCKERKYQDGSDDPGVSFKTPTNIAPEQVASAVRGHENEHVVREQAKARQEGRKVVNQSVTYHTAICPECGKAYVSGGTTRTVTKAADSQQAGQQPKEGRNGPAPFSAVA